MSYVLLSLCFLIPPALGRLSKRFAIVESIGVVTLCYILGLVLGNVPVLEVHEGMTMRVLEIIVPLSIPLLLFGSDLQVFRKRGGTMLKAFLAGAVAVAIAVTLATVLYRDRLDECWKLSSMMTGIFIGGTPNLSAIGLSLDVDHETFVLLNGAEMIYGGIYLLFLLSVGKRVVSKLLHTASADEHEGDFTLDEKFGWPGATLGLGLAALIVGSCAGLSMLIFGKLEQTAVLIGITSLGILASMSGKIRKMPGTFATGNYLLLVFCVAIGSLANVQKILGTGLTMISFVGLIMSCALGLHFLFAKLLRIDTDALIISSAAGVFGPAFIAPIARAMGNPVIIPMGLALSLLGFAMGNYCGLAISQLLRLL